MNMDFSNALERVIEKLESWYTEGLAMLPNIAVAVVVLVLFAFIAKGVSKGIRKVSKRITHHNQLASLFATFGHLFILGLGVFIALEVLDLEKAVTSLLAGVGIVGLALGFAFRDGAANLMSGVIMAVQRPFRPGDIVETQDYFGVVERVELRSTTLRLMTGELVRIPNRLVFENALTNFTERKRRRVDLSVGVAYGDDLAKAKELTEQAVGDIEHRIQGEPVEVFFTGFGDSSIDMTVRFWISYSSQKDYLRARSEAIMAIKSLYDEAGITIPFPIRTLDFGVVGGEPLSDHLHELKILPREEAQRREPEQPIAH